jgi:prepilin-type processing-associated H-X9-DG protein
LPALSTAREHARRVVCLSNIRQLDIAWLMYANEHQGHFCSSETQTLTPQFGNNYYIAGFLTPPPGFWSWIALYGNHHAVQQGVLWPYVKSLQVYACPNNIAALPNSSYAMNALLAGRMGIPNVFATTGRPLGSTFFRLSEIKHPERMFVFIEAKRHVDDGDGDFDQDDLASIDGAFEGGFCPPIYPSRVSQLPGLFHGLNGTNGCTVAFADGHAIFWQYAMSPVNEFARGMIVAPYPDLTQLQAWSGGPPPPGANP